MRPNAVFGNCRSCGARVLWATSKSGARIPLNDGPRESGGNIRLDYDGNGGPVASVVHPGMGSYVSHFATCPQAEKWRKKKP
jgi:hypothetical protein